jgi:hypothetical protein
LDAALWIIALLAALFALDRLLLAMEARGWIYWRKVKRKGAGGGYLLGPDIFDPGKRYLEEAREEHVLEDAENGGDDDKRIKSTV